MIASLVSFAFAASAPLDARHVAHALKPSSEVVRIATRSGMSGLCAYYWESQTTASGERFNKRALTAAHKTLPFGTKVRVTRTDTGSSVVVRINDRGPYGGGRVIDVSERAAEVLGMKGRGIAPVRLEVVGR